MHAFLVPLRGESIPPALPTSRHGSLSAAHGTLSPSAKALVSGLLLLGLPSLMVFI